MFCRDCGRELAFEAVVCLHCGVVPPQGDRFCQRCGAGVAAIATVCPGCGVRLARTEVAARGGKSKTAAVVLAVFLSYWAWLYTYKKDRTKFWVGLGVSLGGNLFLILLTRGLWMRVAPFVALGIWVWAVVDAATKRREWYESY